MPYVSRPSWLNGGPDQAEQKPSSSVGASPTPGAASPTPPGSAPAAGASGLPGVQGTGFVNLNQYLQEGRGQAQGYASKNIVDPMNQKALGVSQDATKQADRYSYWDKQQTDRSAAEKNNEGLAPVSNEDATYAWTKKRDNLFNDPLMRGNEDLQRAWTNANPAPAGVLRNPAMQDLPGVAAQPMPDQSLSGRASAINADRRSTNTMEGRGSMFARQAGQGYGYGNFDSFLSGGKPWAGVANNYPTLWQQIKGNPGAVTPGDMGPDEKPPVHYGADGQPISAPPAAKPPDDGSGLGTNTYAIRSPKVRR
jgi:hypothetical protein